MGIGLAESSEQSAGGSVGYCAGAEKAIGAHTIAPATASTHALAIEAASNGSISTRLSSGIITNIAPSSRMGTGNVRLSKRAILLATRFWVFDLGRWNLGRQRHTDRG